jgi:hypothetical protein
LDRSGAGGGIDIDAGRDRRLDKRYPTGVIAHKRAFSRMGAHGRAWTRMDAQEKPVPRERPAGRPSLTNKEQ